MSWHAALSDASPVAGVASVVRGVAKGVVEGEMLARTRRGVSSPGAGQGLACDMAFGVSHAVDSAIICMLCR